MKIGVTAAAVHPRSSLVRWGLALAVGALAAAGPVLAADPQSLKDVLGRVQTDAEKKAVEDLVDKLKGVPRKAPPPAPVPTATTAPPPAVPPAAATTTTSAAPAPATLPPSTLAPAAPERAPATQPDRVATPAPVTETPPPAVTPDTAITSAEQRQVPSVDIEVFFDYKSAEIKGKAIEQLTALGRALSDARLADDAFVIAGHTDAKGGADYNLELSRRRAEAAIQFLADNFKIDRAKLVARGYGFQHLKNKAKPLAAENRRVQIVNLSKDERR